jgi:hypothetical protein
VAAAQRYRLLGDGRHQNRGHRAASDLVLAHQPVEEGAQAAVPVGHRGRRVAGVLQADQVGLDVLAPNVGHLARHAGTGQEGVELGDGLEVAGAGAYLAVGRRQMG